MATTHFSISQFYGAKYGSADNLVQLGCAADAANIDTSDGALQTLTGAVPFPDILDNNSITLNPRLMWCVGYSLRMLSIDANGLVGISKNASDQKYHASYAYVPSQYYEEQVALFESASTADRVFHTVIDGTPVAIALHTGTDARPIVINYADEYGIREFGSGEFMTSDEITGVFTDAQNRITGVRIDRVMTDDEIIRCTYAGVYIMETEDQELDFIAAYVRVCRLFEDHTTIVFKDPLPAQSVSVGNYVKVRGGLSAQPVSFMQMHYGRLFAAGDHNFPNRLYWSCLPGDGRTIEDWSADDASPDTGGGYVEVGDSGFISALFSYKSQLLIWKGDELWRLYGATPSQYTLELVSRGAGYVNEYSNNLVGYNVMQDRIADVGGVPYVLLDDGLFCYNGSDLVRVDSDDTVRDFLSQNALASPSEYQHNLQSEVSNVYGVYWWRDSLYFCLRSHKTRPQDGYGKLVVARYNLRDGTMSFLYGTENIFVFRRGLVLANVSMKKLYLLLDDFNYVEGTDRLGDGWEQLYRKLPVDESPWESDIDAWWESQDLTFGEVSYTKTLRRIGMDVTGPIRVIIKSPEQVMHDNVYDTTDIRARRFLWIPVEMPYECSFRIRFESVDGQPFRIHNGVDFYITTNQRN